MNDGPTLDAVFYGGLEKGSQLIERMEDQYLVAGLLFGAMLLFALLLWAKMPRNQKGPDTVAKLAIIALSFFALAGFAGSVFGNRRAATTHEKMPRFDAPTVFVEWEKEVRLGPFLITPDKIDTLEAAIPELGLPTTRPATPEEKAAAAAAAEKEATDHWKENRRVYGEDSIRRFLCAGYTRLEKEIRLSGESLKGWPDGQGGRPDYLAEELSGADLINLLETMEKQLIYERRGKKTRTMRDAFSKWALVQFKFIVDGRPYQDNSFYVKGNRVQLPKDGTGQKYLLEVVDIFNGDTKIKESEGCILRLLKAPRSAP